MDFSAIRQNRFFIAIAILLPIIYGIFFVRNFTLPITGGGDIDEWEFVGYYLAENLRFDIVPQLILKQNQTLYPYGVTQVFSDWSLESNYWFAFFYKIWGHGAWLNYYYVLSLIISFLGSYLLLKKEFGRNKAFLAGVVVTFFNFYALHKYPYHFNHSTIHWAILSIFSDFILTKRIILKERLSLKWIFLKAFLLIATLGMNLGYICGFALTSFTLCLFIVLIVLLARLSKSQNQFKTYLQNWIGELKNNKRLYILLAAPSLILLYLYLPLVWQIYEESKSARNINAPVAVVNWSHPLRILFPYFSFFNTTYNPLIDVLNDRPEGLGSGSPGWFCLGLGITGLLYNNKKYRLVFLPLIVLVVLSVFYHPNRVPTLKVFPWGTFNRVPSRFTSILPVILTCFFLPIDFYRIKYRRFISGVLITLSIVEGWVVFRGLYNKTPYIVDNNFFNYMSVIEKQEGEALLDFPFCVIGGDGTGHRENLCPIYEKTCNVYALRRFHHKKVVGAYYSYIHPKTINSFVNIGVAHMFNTNSPGFNFDAKILREFTEEEMRYFIKYFQYNDFVGINLCVELITQKMYQQIVEAVGKPIQTTVLPGAGKAVFIPKPTEWKKLVNPAKAAGMKFPCDCN